MHVEDRETLSNSLLNICDIRNKP